MVQSKRAPKQRVSTPGARQIYEALRDQIGQGVYGTDGVLPSSRSLAAELNVSRTTVTVAYEQLAAEGFVDIRHGKRPRVAHAAIEPKNPKKVRGQKQRTVRISAYAERLQGVRVRGEPSKARLIADFRYGDLAPSDFPVLAWKRAMVGAITQRPDRLAYDNPRGSRRLRIALQAYLWRARMIRCELEQIIIVNGSQQGLDLCARLLLDPGDRFVIENPCYAMARDVFSATGATLVSIPVDKDGLQTDRLAGTVARLAYVTPSHQFPLGGVMTVGRRHQLLAWARQSDAYIVEDDYDSEYRYDIDPVPPLHSLNDNENVIYLGTVSKTLSPGIRVGYLVVPSQLQESFAAAKQLTDRHTSTSDQAALSELLENGVYESHVRKVRRRNGERRETLLKALQKAFGSDIAVEGADAGLHVAVWLHRIPVAMEPRLIDEARRSGVGIHSVKPLYDPQMPDQSPRTVGLVIGYAALDTRQIERGVAALKLAVDRIGRGSG